MLAVGIKVRVLPQPQVMSRWHNVEAVIARIYEANGVRKEPMFALDFGERMFTYGKEKGRPFLVGFLEEELAVVI